MSFVAHSDHDMLAENDSGSDTPLSSRWVYPFEDGTASMADLLGGKGAGLAEMTRIGLPVPPGFTITTQACLEYLNGSEQLPSSLWDETQSAMKDIGNKLGRFFGDAESPLLVSGRSGAKFSMPGMMDTVLNIGLNDLIVETLERQTGDPRFVWDLYRRLIQMFGKVVLGVSGAAFEELVESIKQSEGVHSDPEISAEGWQQTVDKFKMLIKTQTDQEFPQDPWKQLDMVIQAVFRSWNGKRAVDYRNAVGISHDLGTAVNIVAMVFGNVGETSGSGVAFTRDPATGEKTLYGEYLTNAQGEDVVSGARTPIQVSQLETTNPDLRKALADVAQKLETHYREMQDIEFTIENGKLWLLQTRNGKRTAQAAVKIAVDMVGEGLITREEAVARIIPSHIEQLMHPRFTEEVRQSATLLAKGLNASPGAAVGIVVFDADTAERVAKEEGKAVILVRPETTPDDVHGMLAAKGILTQHGGATSHAAVVARQLGKPCVAGCEAIAVDVAKRQFRVGDRIIEEGAVISLDGAHGEVFDGALSLVEPNLKDYDELQRILGWADDIRKLEVWANADTPEQAEVARSYGAQGIGLCRTEHMFLGDRTARFQEAILAPSDDEFNRILSEVLLPLQRDDFYGIFKVMDGLPVIIRLLDPPLHEFLPAQEHLLEEIYTLKAAGKPEPELEDKKQLLAIVRDMHEFNPMLGLRGCRLGIMHPALNRMQVRAIFEAACDAALEGVKVFPEVMIPLTSHVNELKTIQPLLEEEARMVMEEKNITVGYKFGTMIEIPRAALTAGEVAAVAQFFSFGTNDLTQMTYGISRDDAERKFLLAYVEKGILPENPFQSIDVIGIGRLMDIAVTDGRASRPDLEVGICGEHGGDPASIAFCQSIGLDYVSCSPYRLPVARLAAAHAVITEIRKASEDL